MDILTAIGLVPGKGYVIAAVAELVIEIGQVQQFVGTDEHQDSLAPIGQRLDGIHLILQAP